MKTTIKDKIRGSLVGGAVGDALGYPVEFILEYEKIQARYGADGIREFDTSHWWIKSPATVSQDKAWISDDTQMTLYTACGILGGSKSYQGILQNIKDAYIEWMLIYQYHKYNVRGFHQCWITDLPQMRERRAPGHTCLGSLDTIYKGYEVYNDSRGCGGVMRIAPIPLYALCHGNLNIEESDRLAAETAYITHHHPLACIPAAFMAHIIYRLAEDEFPTPEKFKGYIIEALDALDRYYPKENEYRTDFRNRIEYAIFLAETDGNDVICIEQIGQGWIGDEAVAIATYCTYKYFNDFDKALIAAVNHKGDSDSVGAVTGNILGAAVGYDAIPQHFKDKLELHDVILHIADDLWRGKATKFEPVIINNDK